MSSGLRNKIALLILKRKKKNLFRRKTFVSFDKIKKILVLFDVGNDNYKNVKYVIDYLDNQGKDVSALGYIDKKIIPDQYLLKSKFEFFCKSDLNFWGIPNKPNVQNFINTESDLYIDLTNTNTFALKYINFLSIARLKAGFYSDKNEHLDFMITITRESGYQEMLEQLIHYLKMLQN